MKHMKRLASVLLMLAMVLSVSVAAFAVTTNGSITIKSSNTVSVEGKTFTAYKILDLQMVGDDGCVYTVPEALKSFFSTAFKDEDGNTKTLDTASGDFDAQVREEIAKFDANSDELFAFAAAALKAAKVAGIVPKSVTGRAEDESVTIDDLPYGYYVVADETASGDAAKVISALMLDSVHGDTNITLKADNPSVDKEIVEDNSATKNNNAAVGDTVPFQIISKVPDMTGFVKYYFVLNDTFSKGLTFNDNAEVFIGDTKLDRVYVQTVGGK